jgi:hypothetical protein
MISLHTHAITRSITNDMRNRVSFCVSLIKAMGLALVPAIPLVIWNPVIAFAVTKEEAARCRAISNNIERRDCFKSLREGASAKADEAARAKAGTEPSPAPATTSAVDHIGATPDQPVCVDRDALAAILAAGVLASSPAQTRTNGCQTIPEDGKVEVLERYPSALGFLRVIKVKVTSAALPDSTVGFTIEIGH